MRNGLLPHAIITAAVMLSPIPANAQRWSDPGFLAAAGVAVHRGGTPSGTLSPGPQGQFSNNWRTPGQHHDGRHDDGFAGGYVYEDREWQGDTAWRPTSYNDWWHESPRSFPRWMQNNQDCQRMWWSGGGWRC